MPGARKRLFQTTNLREHVGLGPVAELLDRAQRGFRLVPNPEPGCSDRDSAKVAKVQELKDITCRGNVRRCRCIRGMAVERADLRHRAVGLGWIALEEADPRLRQISAVLESTGTGQQPLNRILGQSWPDPDFLPIGVMVEKVVRSMVERVEPLVSLRVDRALRQMIRFNGNHDDNLPLRSHHRGTGRLYL